MIEELRVHGVGGIVSAEMVFRGAFIVITGESGTGKSSLVRAFEFISGKRAQASSIHAGSEESTVEALWGIDRDGESLLTSRALSRSGKGRCLIHGALSTVGQLADFSQSLIEIQSQFAQLNLLDSTRQLELVDQCGGAELIDTRKRLAGLFPEMLAVEKEILDLKKRRSELERDLEAAPAHVRRIKALSLYENCESEWMQELATLEKRLSDAGRFDALIEQMQGGETGVDFAEGMERLLRALYAVAPEELRERWMELGEAALSNVQELFASARTELNMIPREQLESQADELEARIGALRKVKRETGLETTAELLSYIGEVEEDMAWLKESHAVLAEKNERAAELRAEVGAVVRRLRTLRERAAADFTARVNAHLGGLGMEDARFFVEVVKHDKVRAGGAEGVAFLLAQKEMSPGPVSRVASGGELSRILIAIQVSINAEKLPGTLVFDEVEAGLGGKTALLAGQKLRTLSHVCRTILITHEATIAAMADQHFVVRRVGDETLVGEISGAERELEIARMLAGSESREAVEHARALLESARSETN